MSDIAIQDLVQELETQFYQPAEQFCRKINEYIIEIHGGDDDQIASLFTSLCKKLTKEVGYYLRIRRNFLRQYVTGKLPEKIKNADRPIQPDVASMQIQNLLVKLRGVVPAIPHQVLRQDFDALLHHEIRKLDECLTRMFLFEQSLFPQLISKDCAVSGKDA